MAVEDAEALKVALSSLQPTSIPDDDRSRVKINALLKQVQDLRYERATLVQLRSLAATAYYFDLPTAADQLES